MLQQRFSTDINIKDCFGNTALMRACLHNDYPVVELLLSQGADIHLSNSTGASALHIAMHYSNIAIVRRLYQAGADFNLTDHFGKRPFDYIHDQSYSRSQTFGQRSKA